MIYENKQKKIKSHTQIIVNICKFLTYFKQNELNSF